MKEFHESDTSVMCGTGYLPTEVSRPLHESLNKLAAALKALEAVKC